MVYLLFSVGLKEKRLEAVNVNANKKRKTNDDINKRDTPWGCKNN